MKLIIKAITLILVICMCIPMLFSCTVNTEDSTTNAPDNGSENSGEGENYILFGSYPQTAVTDAELLSKLSSMAGELPVADNSKGWTSYGYYKGTGEENSQSNSEDYMWYMDLDYDGDGTKDYRGVYFDQYRPYYTSYISTANNSQQDDNGYYKGRVYWFKYEPIKWRVLAEENGEAFIFCEMLIDSQQFYHDTSERIENGTTIYANNYAYSDIRAWLNDSFYNAAFDNEEKASIITRTVNNGENTTGSLTNGYVCETTEDNVFLLSYQEVTDSAYFGDGTQREKKATDYAQCQGAWVAATSDYAGNGWWWIRSPYNTESYYVCDVDYGGYAYFFYANFTRRGVCPALWISK